MCSSTGIRHTSVGSLTDPTSPSESFAAATTPYGIRSAFRLPFGASAPTSFCIPSSPCRCCRAVPSIMVLHGADWWLPEAAHFYTRLDRLYMHAFMPLYLKRAAAVLSVSQLTTDHFNRIFRLPPGKVRTTYFAPARHFRRVDDRRDVATSQGTLPSAGPVPPHAVEGSWRRQEEHWRRLSRLRAHARDGAARNWSSSGKGCERFRARVRGADERLGRRCAVSPAGLISRICRRSTR